MARGRRRWTYTERKATMADEPCQCKVTDRVFVLGEGGVRHANHDISIERAFCVQLPDL